MTIVLNGTTGVTTPSIDAGAGNADLTTLSVAGNEVSAVNSLGFRNRLINSDMRIDQRNAGASVTPTTDSTYTLDRWETRLTQASKFSVQRSSTAPSGFTYSLLATSLSAYSVTSTDRFAIAQKIEAFNTADLGWGAAGAASVTLSFWVRSSLTGTFGGSLANSDGDSFYVFSYTIDAANTWEQKSITIAGPTSGGAWGTTNGIGINIRFSIGAGSTLVSSAGSWGSTNFWSVTGQTSVVGTSGATFYITGVQLEAGSVATPFERRPYGTELALCQRYYERIVSGGTLYVARVSGVQTYWIGNYKASKRAVPTVSLPAVNTASDSTSHTPAAMNSTEYGSWYATLGGSLTNNVNSFTFVADAEL